MLRDDDIMTIDRERLDDDNHEIVGKFEVPNASHEGIVDVISMRALVRAVSNLRRATDKTRTGDFERTLIKLINLNGAVARVIADDKRG